ncbi:hypothetical protein OROMI_018351 [Orobanche minor]
MKCYPVSVPHNELIEEAFPDPEWNGNSSTSAAYRGLSEEDDEDVRRDSLKAFKRLWMCHAPRRVQAIVWKLLEERMPTKDNLARRGGQHQPDNLTCKLCGEDDQTQSHLFFQCQFTTEIWNSCYKWFKVDMVPHNIPFRHLLQHGHLFGNDKKSKKATTVWACIIWLIWKAIHDYIFNNLALDSAKTCELVKGRVWAWLHSKFPMGNHHMYSKWLNDPNNCFIKS